MRQLFVGRGVASASGERAGGCIPPNILPINHPAIHFSVSHSYFSAETRPSKQPTVSAGFDKLLFRALGRVVLPWSSANQFARA